MSEQSVPSSSSSVRIFEALIENPGVVMTLGGPDSGKTTWVGAAASQLAGKGCAPIAVVDTDLGQTTLGPPATVALGLIQGPSERGTCFPACSPHALYFVGSVSPRAHLLPTLVACTRLVEKAKHLGARTVLVDTSGFISPGAGFQLKLRKIELLNPTHLLVFQHGKELEPLLSVISHRRGLHIHRLDVSSWVKRRTPEERALYRAKRFAEYFSDSTVLPLSLNHRTILTPPIRHSLPSLADSDVLRDLRGLIGKPWRGLLIGLNTGQNETLGLGLLEGVHEKDSQFLVRTPLTDVSSLEILQLGSMCLTASWHEIGLFHERF